MTQILVVKLPNGEPLRLGYEAVNSAMLDVYLSGVTVGSFKAHTKQKINEDTQTQIATSRSSSQRALEVAIETLVREGVTAAWTRAKGELFPFKCAECGLRFATMKELVAHATEGVRELYSAEPEELVRPDCYAAMETALIIASQ